MPRRAARIEVVSGDNDPTATEVARYNLQGQPVDKHERGVQIVVYSDFTARTVVVQ